MEEATVFSFRNMFFEVTTDSALQATLVDVVTISRAKHVVLFGLVWWYSELEDVPLARVYAHCDNYKKTTVQHQQKKSIHGGYVDASGCREGQERCILML